MLNKNEAPEGFEAVKFIKTSTNFHCDNCDITEMSNEDCLSNPCHESARKDGTTVYFVRRTSNMSALLHPMGSLGEEV